MRVSRVSHLYGRGPGVVSSRRVVTRKTVVSSLVLSRCLRRYAGGGFVLGSYRFVQLKLSQGPSVGCIGGGMRRLVGSYPSIPVLVARDHLYGGTCSRISFFPRVKGRCCTAIVKTMFRTSRVVASLHSSRVYFQNVRRAQALACNRTRGFVSDNVTLLRPRYVPLTHATNVTVMLVGAPRSALQVSSRGAKAGMGTTISHENIIFIGLHSLKILASCLFVNGMFSIFRGCGIPICLTASSGIDISLTIGYDGSALHLVCHRLRGCTRVKVRARVSIIDIVNSLG